MSGALWFDTLEKLPERRLEQAAEVLVEAFRHAPSDWSELKSAREEVAAFLRPERFAFVAMEDETVVGWIGAIKHSAQMWELHPLAVRRTVRRGGSEGRWSKCLTRTRDTRG